MNQCNHLKNLLVVQNLVVIEEIFFAPFTLAETATLTLGAFCAGVEVVTDANTRKYLLLGDFVLIHLNNDAAPLLMGQVFLKNEEILAQKAV